MSYLMLAGTALSVMGAIQGGRAQKAMAQAQAAQYEQEAKMTALQAKQAHNDRMAAFSTYTKQVEALRAVNRRDFGDRSLKVLVEASKGKNRSELERQSLQALYGIGKAKYQANISRYEGKMAMQSAYLSAASTMMTGIYRYQQVTAPKTTGG